MKICKLIRKQKTLKIYKKYVDFIETIWYYRLSYYLKKKSHKMWEKNKLVKKIHRENNINTNLLFCAKNMWNIFKKIKNMLTFNK